MYSLFKTITKNKNIFTKLFKYFLLISNFITIIVTIGWYMLWVRFETPFERFIKDRPHLRSNTLTIEQTSLDDLYQIQIRSRNQKISNALWSVEQSAKLGGDIFTLINIAKKNAKEELLENQNEYFSLLTKLPDDYFGYQVKFDAGETIINGVLILDRKGNVLRDLLTGEFENP